MFFKNNKFKHKCYVKIKCFFSKKKISLKFYKLYIKNAKTLNTFYGNKSVCYYGNKLAVFKTIHLLLLTTEKISSQ